MALAHISLGKVVSLAVGATVAFVVAMDPTWKMFIVGALIASIPPTITGLFALRLQAKNGAALGRVEHKVDGAAEILRASSVAANSRADQAEGEARGIESERTRGKP